jgi:hypothetical protein
LYLSRNARQSASIRAVFPEPTGLRQILSVWLLLARTALLCIPTDTNSECTLSPISTFYNGHFTSEIRARAVQYFVSVAVISTDV